MIRRSSFEEFDSETTGQHDKTYLVTSLRIFALLRSAPASAEEGNWGCMDELSRGRGDNKAEDEVEYILRKY